MRYTQWEHPQAGKTRWLQVKTTLWRWLVGTLARLPHRGTVAFVTWVLRDVLRYRRRVIADNLARSFPQFSTEARERIRHDYYAHLAAVVVESLELHRMTAADLRRQVVLSGWDVFAHYARQNRPVVILSAHQGNWEWSGPRLALEPIGMPLYGVYKRLRNVAMDRLLHRARSHTGMQLVEYADTFRAVMLAQQSQQPWAFALIADQTPHEGQGHWVSFLHQPTQFFTGPAKLATRFNAPLVWVRSFRDGPGRYRVTCTVFEDQPASHSIETLTERFARELEADIHQYPAQWLWSHRRWKHRPPADFPAAP